MKETSVFLIAMCFVIACCSAAEGDKDQKKEKFTPSPSDFQTLRSSSVESVTTEAMQKDLQMAQQKHQSTQMKASFNRQRDSTFSYENTRRTSDFNNQNRVSSNSPVSPRQRFPSQRATTETSLSTLFPQTSTDRQQFSKSMLPQFQSDYKGRSPSNAEQVFPVEGRRQQNSYRQQNRNVIPVEHLTGMQQGHQFNPMNNQQVYPENQLSRDEMSVFGRRNVLNDKRGNEGKMLKGQEQFQFGRQLFGAQMPDYGRQQVESRHQFNPYRQDAKHQEQYYRQEQQVRRQEQPYQKGTDFGRNHQQVSNQQQQRGQAAFDYARQEEFHRQQAFSTGSGQRESFDQYYNPQQGVPAQDLTKQQVFLRRFDQQQPQEQYYNQQQSQEQYYNQQQAQEQYHNQQQPQQQYHNQQPQEQYHNQQQLQEQYHNQQQQRRGQDFYPQNQPLLPNEERYLNRKENIPVQNYQPGRDEFVHGLDYKSNQQSSDSTRFQQVGKEQFLTQPMSRRAFLGEDSQDGTQQSSTMNPMSDDRDRHSFMTEKSVNEHQVPTVKKQEQTNPQSFEDNSPKSVPIGNDKGSSILPESRSLSESVLFTGIQSLPVHPALIYNTGEIPSSHAVVVSSDSVSPQEGASVRHHLQTPHVQFIYRHPL